MDLDLVSSMLLGLAVLDALAATFAVLPGVGIPLGGAREVLDIELPRDLAAKTDARTFLVGSDLEGSSETQIRWQSETRIAFACPWLWSINGLGASPVTGWIDVLPGEPAAGQVTFCYRRVGRAWPLLVVLGFAVNTLRFGALELSAGALGVLWVVVGLAMIRPAARTATGMFHEVTANLARDHRR